MMLRLMFAMIAGSCALTSTSNAQQPVTWTRHTNHLYHFLIDIPDILAWSADRSGGITFKSKENSRVRATILATSESRPGFPGNDPETDIAPTLDTCDKLPPVYRTVKARMAAYSCVKGENIIYSIARYDGRRSVVFDITYPTTQASVWNAIVQRMSKSLRLMDSAVGVHFSPSSFGFDSDRTPLRSPGLSRRGEASGDRLRVGVREVG